MRALLAIALMVTAAAAEAEPLKFYNGRLFISATINRVSTEALLDSGAEATLVDPVLAAKAKLPEGKAQVIKGSGGAAPAHIVEGVTVGALGMELHPDAVVVLDMTDLSKRLIKRPTHAIVGRELFDSARLAINISAGEISTVSRDVEPRGEKLPLTGHAGIEGIPVKANGALAQAEFDLGNGSDVLISREMVKKLGLKIIGKKSGGGIGGALNRDVVRLNSLEVAGKTFHNVTATIDDQPSHNDLNVGTEILKNFAITTDFKDRAVWLQPLGEKN
ncbi:MAG TPA: pepsin/retropepsin-like aspartic protease family protein [Sphingomicrobium sp.]|nr:pepsin/retropepsin-like aspartic protease family protein [Sphingomicrobium sp.]